MEGARRLQADTKVRKLGSSRMQETGLVGPKLGRRVFGHQAEPEGVWRLQARLKAEWSFAASGFDEGGLGDPRL